MADVKISALPSASTPLAGTEVLPIVQGGTTDKVSVANLTAGRTVDAAAVVVDAGTVSAPSLTFSGDTNTGVYSPAADIIAFTEGGVESMRLNASGNVGIGTTSPAARLHVDGSTRLDGNVETAETIFVYSWDGGTQGQVRSGVRMDGSGQTLQFYTQVAERVRIDANGNTYFGNNTAYATGAVTRVYGDALSGYARIDLNKFTSGTFTNVGFYHRGTSVGAINVSDTATAYVTSSDYRLKENVVPLTDAAARVQALKPSRFNFIADPDRTVDGFIAHEAAEVVPEAVTGEKDAVDAEGRIQPQGIDHSKLVPLLTAALQEALTEIAALKARVAALDNK